MVKYFILRIRVFFSYCFSHSQRKRINQTLSLLEEVMKKSFQKVRIRRLEEIFIPETALKPLQTQRSPNITLLLQKLFPPHPNRSAELATKPSPWEGGRLGVMISENFMQRLGSLSALLCLWDLKEIIP